MVLISSSKECPSNRAQNEIQFETSYFFIQVHGLPPTLFYKNNAVKIGNIIGKIDRNTINSRFVIKQRYFRSRIKIIVESPIPTGFFQKKASGEENWFNSSLNVLLIFTTNVSCWIMSLVDALVCLSWGSHQRMAYQQSYIVPVSEQRILVTCSSLIHWKKMLTSERL